MILFYGKQWIREYLNKFNTRRSYIILFAPAKYWYFLTLIILLYYILGEEYFKINHSFYFDEYFKDEKNKKIIKLLK